MSKLKGFVPIADSNAKVLILGSMPSETSLLKQQYYGHPRNAFWPIMGALFAAFPELAYDQRTAIIKQNKIAIWDVVKTCKRAGSLDADIKKSSIESNNFKDFFNTHPLINKVFFNGRKAEDIFAKSIAPDLKECVKCLNLQCLPSTSPAYASMTLQQKISAWQVVKQASTSNEE